MIEPFWKIPGALQHPRQQVEHRRRVSFLAGRFAGGQADLALRHGEAGDRIHDQQHVGALVAKIFGDRQRHETGADAQRRGTVRSGADHHRTLAAFGTQLVFEKGAHFAIALADQRDHRDIGGIVARHGAEQSALADAAAAEDPHALAFAAGHHGIDGADAGGNRLDDVLAVQRAAGRVVERVMRGGPDARLAVDGLAEAVEHAADQVGTDGDSGVAAGGR